MQKILIFRNEVIKKIFILLLIVTAITFILNEYTVMKGFLAGAITSLILFLIRTKEILKKMEQRKYNFVNQSIFSFLVRYFAMFVILSLAFLKPGINFPAAVAGLFSLQMIIMWNEVIEQKIGIKRRIKYCE